MKIRTLLIGVAALILASVPTLWAITTLRNVAIVQSTIATTSISTSAITASTIDSSPIGATTPSTAAVTTLSVGGGTTIKQILNYNTSVAFSSINAGTCGNTTITGPANANAAIFVNFLNYSLAFGSLNMNISASAPTSGNINVVLCNTTTSAGLAYGGGTVSVNILIVQ